MKGQTVWLRARVSAGANVQFSYGVDESAFIEAGASFVARPGRWIGAKVGLFALASRPGAEYGYADFDSFKVE